MPSSATLPSVLGKVRMALSSSIGTQSWTHRCMDPTHGLYIILSYLALVQLPACAIIWISVAAHEARARERIARDRAALRRVSCEVRVESGYRVEARGSR